MSTTCRARKYKRKKRKQIGLPNWPDNDMQKHQGMHERFLTLAYCPSEILLTSPNPLLCRIRVDHCFVPSLIIMSTCFRCRRYSLKMVTFTWRQEQSTKPLSRNLLNPIGFLNLGWTFSQNVAKRFYNNMTLDLSDFCCNWCTRKTLTKNKLSK